MRVPDGANLTVVSSAVDVRAEMLCVAVAEAGPSAPSSASAGWLASTGWGMSVVSPAVGEAAGFSASCAVPPSVFTAPLIASADFEKRLLSTEDETVAAAAPTMAPMSEPATPICEENANDTPAASALARIWANERSPNTPPVRSSCWSFSASVPLAYVFGSCAKAHPSFGRVPARPYCLGYPSIGCGQRLAPILTKK